MAKIRFGVLEEIHTRIMKVKVSIIMAAYNASSFIEEAIRSVQQQDYQWFELIVVNDGSTDQTEAVVKSIKDPRVRYLKQKNSGVSAARNLGLVNMTGSFFCFLDADDMMTKKALTSRMAVFRKDKCLAFVGGGQEQRNEDLSIRLVIQRPSYQGMPRKGLVSLDSKCFINCGTWLIRRNPDVDYHFPVGWTHSEDLAFFLSICMQGPLKSITDIVQVYRRHTSTMSDLDGLKRGYLRLIHFIQEEDLFENRNEKKTLIRRIKRIMFLSYLRSGAIYKAIRFVLSNVR